MGFALCLSLISPALPARADTTAILANNVLRSINVLSPTRLTDPSTVIGLGIGLRGGDPAGEAAFIAAAYDPTSATYGQFLDADEYETRFGVPASRFSAAVSWLQSGGLTVQTIPGSSEYLLASGTVAQVQNLFSVTIADYHIDSGDFYANQNAPSVPASLGVIGIAGLNSLEGPRLSTNRNAKPQSRPATLSPSADMGLTAPSDLWSIYDQPSNNKGEGQQLAIFGWGTTKNTTSDLRQFEAKFSLPAVPFSIAYYGTETQVTDSGGEGEWDIDTQASTGMAPNVVAEKLYFGKAGTDADLLGAYNAWAGDKHGPLQGSSSFSGCEEAPGTDGLSGSPANPGGIIIAGNPKQDLWEAALRRAVAEGRTMFASTGDTGSGCPAVSIVVNGATLIPTPMMGYPAVSSYAVGVGGTVLYWNDATATTPASRALEYSWNYTGGGTSLFIAAGAYQNTSPAILTYHCVTDPHGNPYPVPPPLCRGIPDISAQSGDITGNGYQIISGGNNGSGGGTSLSSPLWLGMWARIQAASSAKKGLGFANPAIYRIASDPAKYARDFFDIGGLSTDTMPNCNGDQCTKPGWDYVSGWGTPDVTKLMLDLDGTTTPKRLTTVNPVPVINPPIVGTTCPGPQVPDNVGDAPNNVPGGDGSNADMLDIVSASFTNVTNAVRITLTLKDLEAPPTVSAPNFDSALWTVYFDYNGTRWYGQARVRAGTGGVAVYSFNDGFDNGSFNNLHTINGTATPGPNGTLVMDVPLADFGYDAVAHGTILGRPSADSHAFLAANGTGVYWTSPVDRAPDLGFGSNWIVGQNCP